MGACFVACRRGVEFPWTACGTPAELLHFGPSLDAKAGQDFIHWPVYCCSPFLARQESKALFIPTFNPVQNVTVALREWKRRLLIWHFLLQASGQGWDGQELGVEGAFAPSSLLTSQSNWQATQEVVGHFIKRGSNFLIIPPCPDHVFWIRISSLVHS